MIFVNQYGVVYEEHLREVTFILLLLFVITFSETIFTSSPESVWNVFNET